MLQTFLIVRSKNGIYILKKLYGLLFKKDRERQRSRFKNNWQSLSNPFGDGGSCPGWGPLIGQLFMHSRSHNHRGPQEERHCPHIILSYLIIWPEF